MFGLSRKLTMKLPLLRILLVFLVITIALTAAAVGCVLVLYRNNILLNEERYINQSITEDKETLESTLYNIKNALYALTSRQEISKYIGGSEAYKCENMKYIIGKMDDLIRYMPVIDNVLLVTPMGQITHDSIGKDPSVNLFMSQKRIVEQYMSQKQNDVKYLPVEIIGDAEKKNILFVIVPVQPVEFGVYEKDTGACYAICSMDDLLNNMQITKYHYMLLNGKEVIASNCESWVDYELLKSSIGKNVIVKEKSYRVINAFVELADLQLVIAYPHDNISKEFIDFARWSLLFIVIFILGECFLSIVIYLSIINPIKLINHQVNEIQALDWHIENPTKKRNELNGLVDGINLMLERTNNLNQQIYNAKFGLLKERNLFLQSQVNPHFLYNMFECICGMAAKTNQNNIREMTSLLALMYRYCLQGQEATLEEEIDSVRIFHNIIALRYEEAYSININISEDLYVLKMPRMIIEPIVENAIQHGFKRGIRITGKIQISASFSDNTLVIVVSDNGCGLSEDELDKINAKLVCFDSDQEIENSSIGLFNVNSRLKLRHGLKSGLHLKINEQGGVEVVLSIVYDSSDS